MTTYVIAGILEPLICICLYTQLKYVPKLTRFLRELFRFTYIYLNAKISQLLLKCYFLLFEPNILLYDIVINKSNDLPSKQHKNQTSETYDCQSSARNVRQPKFKKSQSCIILHFVQKRCLTIISPAKFCSTTWRCSRTVLEHLELF